MKRSIATVLLSVLLGLASISAYSEDVPGQIDFGSFTPPKAGGEFVEVNIPQSLIFLASRFVEKQEPEAAELIKSLKFIRVNVVGMDDENRANVEENIAKARQSLSGKGWERIVKVQQKDQDVGVYMKSGEKDSVQGIAVLVLDGKKAAVLVNIVGDLKAEQLSKLGERLSMLGDRFDIAPLREVGKNIEKAEAEKEK
jgi:hypothetical protein